MRSKNYGMRNLPRRKTGAVRFQRTSFSSFKLKSIVEQHQTLTDRVYIYSLRWTHSETANNHELTGKPSLYLM